MNKFAGIDLQRYLEALGDILTEMDAPAQLVVVGGASIILQGLVQRTTGDVDVLARLDNTGALIVPHPLTPELKQAIRTVARDFGLSEDWLNTTVARNWEEQWPRGLPRGLNDLHWKQYGALEVGLAGRSTLIPLKLHAVMDRGTLPTFDLNGHVTGTSLNQYDPDTQRHLRDLIALNPTDVELEDASAWVGEQDGSPHVPDLLNVITDYVRDACRAGS